MSKINKKLKNMRLGLDFIPQLSGLLRQWAAQRETLQGLAVGGMPRREWETDGLQTAEKSRLL